MADVMRVAVVDGLQNLPEDFLCRHKVHTARVLLEFVKDSMVHQLRAKRPATRSGHCAPSAGLKN